jgi:hypothetical protein
MVLVSNSFALIDPNTDFDHDGVADENDLIILIGYWLEAPDADPNCDLNRDGIINFIDYAMFANDWPGGWPIIDYPLIVSDSNETVVQYVVYSIELPVSGESGLVVDINSVPDGIIKDPFTGAKIIEVNDTPWELRRNGDDILYTSDTVGSDSFYWYASDSDEDSSIAEVNVTITANPMDALYLNGEPNSFVTIPDNDYFDINVPDANNTWAVSFFVNNYWRKPYVDLISKRDGGTGWEITIKAGKLQFDVYDANGLNTFSMRSPYSVSDGQWWPVLIEYHYDSEPNSRYVLFDQYASSSNPTPTGQIINDANLVIATNVGIDHLRFWNDINPSLGGGILWADSRTDYTESIFGIGNASEVRYKTDEGSGSTITDDKGNAGDGVFDVNYVIWHPPYGIFKNLVKHYR